MITGTALRGPIRRDGGNLDRMPHSCAALTELSESYPELHLGE
jgi:hypothetical protein